MTIRHPKAVRRFLLQRLYDSYMSDPLQMLTPDDFMADGTLDRHDLAVGMHFLRDDALAEVMLGYRPPLFISARITPKGLELVEDRYEFDRRFPSNAAYAESAVAGLPALVEQLVVEADLCGLERPRRMALLRDVQYLRDEIAQPLTIWRPPVLASLLDWIDEPFEAGAELPASAAIRHELSTHFRELE